MRRRTATESELDREIRVHIDLQAEANVRAGMTPDAARRAALLAFGGVQVTKEAVHDEHRAQIFVEQLTQGIRLALRSFRRSPTFVASVLAILALGMGMAVAMFTVVQAVLLKKLPVREPNRIVILAPFRNPGHELAPWMTEIGKIHAATTTMTDIAGISHLGLDDWPALDGDRSIMLRTTIVTGNFFHVLGARPALGRLPAPSDRGMSMDERRSMAEYDVVISYKAWRERFGSSMSIVGHRIVTPPNTNWVIVGVAPAGLDYPVGVDAWIPAPWDTQIRALGIGRLAPGASANAAGAEYLARAQQVDPAWHLTGVGVQEFGDAMLGHAQPILLAVTAAVALLLLIACINVGHLFIVRATARAREFSLRRALGASYGALVRQLVIESGLLTVAGVVLGATVAAALIRLIIAVAPAQLPRIEDIQTHAAMPLIVVCVGAVSMLLFGVFPALVSARGDPAIQLKLDARAGAGSRRHRRSREGLVVSQIALALVLLSGAGLLVRSLELLIDIPLGYQPDHLAVASLAFQPGTMTTSYNSDAKKSALEDQLARAIGAVPGVSSVTPMALEPFGGTATDIAAFVSEDNPDTLSPMIPWERAGPDYFKTVGVSLVAGRGFLETDRRGSPLVVVVSQSVAQRFWPGQNPIGKRMRYAPAPATPGVVLSPDIYDWRTVVGVASETRIRDFRAGSPMVYLPARQDASVPALFSIRSNAGADVLRPEIQRALAGVDPRITIWSVSSVSTGLDAQLAGPRFGSTLLVGFAAVALILAAVGLYGVMASSVRAQAREIAIRVALGASAGSIRERVLGRALLIAGIGSIVGLLVALASTRVLRSMLFGVSATDPASLAMACVVLVGVALLASYLPARWATRVDPVQALRAD